MNKRKIIDNIIKLFFIICSALTVGFLIWLIAYIVSNGLKGLSWEFISTPYKGDQHGILPMIVSTIYLIIGALAISIPIGIFAAIYLNEYAKQGRILKFIRLATETLAGIPSIIYGLFGFIFFSGVLKMGYSIIAGALTLAIMVLPTIIRTTEEALKAVPMSYREGSLALGATKLFTIFKVVLPNALSGITTGIILSIGRAAGETAAIYFAAGISPRMPKGIFDSGRTLSVHLYLLAKEAGPLEQTFAIATILLIVIVVINFLAYKGIGMMGKKR